MRIIIFPIAIALASSVAMAQQCPPPDTVVYGAGTHHITVPSPNDQNCWQHDCLASITTAYFIDIVLSDSMNAIEFGTELFTNAHLALKVDDCQYSIYDTCGQWWAPDAVYLRDTIVTGTKIRVNVNTDNSTDPGFYIATYPVQSAATPTKNSCNDPQVVGIQNPSSAGEYIYFDPYTMEVVRDLRPFSSYLKREKFQQ